MRLTARRLNRATLARQLLLRREPVEVTEAVRRVVALQAQEAATPYLALWNRLAPFDPACLDAAFADSVLLAYADRSRVIPPAYRPLVIRRNGDVLPTLLVDGHVAGVVVPGCARSRGLPPLCALVERTPGRRGPPPAWLRFSGAGRPR